MHNLKRGVPLTQVTPILFEMNSSTTGPWSRVPAGLGRLVVEHDGMGLTHCDPGSLNTVFATINVAVDAAGARRLIPYLTPSVALTVSNPQLNIRPVTRGVGSGRRCHDLLHCNRVREGNGQAGPRRARAAIVNFQIAAGVCMGAKECERRTNP